MIAVTTVTMRKSVLKGGNNMLLRFLDTDVQCLPDVAIVTDDPLRVKMMVAHHVDCAIQVSENRGMSAYTGTVEGLPVGVYAVGFGISPIRLYLKEMIGLGVRHILYMGECVSHRADIAVNSIVIPCSASAEGARYDANTELAALCLSAAKQENIPVWETAITTEDQYWLAEKRDDSHDDVTDFASGVVFAYARGSGCAAASILTVTENSLSGERMGEAQRQSRFYHASKINIAAARLCQN